MSLTIDGVWKAGVWATTVWADGVWREGAYVPRTTDNIVLNSIGGKPEKKRKKKYGEEFTWEWLTTLEPKVKEVIEQVAREGIEEKTLEELKNEKKKKETRLLNDLIARLEDDGLAYEAKYQAYLLQMRILYIEKQISLLLEKLKQEEMDVMTILMMEM